MFVRIKDDLKNLNIKLYEFDTTKRNEGRFQIIENCGFININTGEIYSDLKELTEKSDIKKYELECLKIKISYHEKSEKERKLVNQQRSMRRTKEKLIDLVNLNFNYWAGNTDHHTKFITLTFKENITSHAIANDEFKKFIKRMRRAFGNDFSYVSVIEYQKRGAIHYHCIFFNLPYIHYKKFNEIWGLGYTDLQSLEKVENVGFYITKCLDYMLEDMDKKQENQKFYLSSRNIIKLEEKYYSLSDNKAMEILRIAELEKCKIYNYDVLQNITMFNINKKKLEGVI